MSNAPTEPSVQNKADQEAKPSAEKSPDQPKVEEKAPETKPSEEKPNPEKPAELKPEAVPVTQKAKTKSETKVPEPTKDSSIKPAEPPVAKKEGPKVTLATSKIPQTLSPSSSPLTSPSRASPKSSLESPKLTGSDKDQIQELLRLLKEQKLANEELRAQARETNDQRSSRLEKEVASLKSKLEQRNIAADGFRKQAVTLQLELDGVLDKIKSADEFIAKGTQYEEKIASLQKDIALLQGMNEQNSNLNARVGELSSAIDKKNEQIRLLREDIDRRDQEILAVKTQVRELKVEQLAKDTQIAELKKVVDRSTQIKNAPALSTSATSDNFAYDINVRDDKDTQLAAPAEKTISPAQKELFDELSQKISSLSIDLENSKTALKHQTEIAVQSEKELTALKAKNLEAKVEAQRNQLDQVRAQFKAEESLRAKLAQDLEKSKEEAIELLKKVEHSRTVEQENIGLNNQTTHLRAEIQRLEEVIANKDELLAETRKDLEVQAFKASASIVRTQTIKATLLEANTEARKVEEQTQQSQTKEIDALKGRIRELESILQTTRTSSTETKATSRVNARKARTMETLVEDLKHEITQKDSNIKDLNVKIEELKKQKSQVTLEMEKYKSEATHANHRLGMQKPSHSPSVQSS